jgi:hypothetical protein
MDSKLINLLPIMGVLFGVAFLGAATALYPGDYQWSEHTISALFQSATPSGVANPARPLAMMGVLTAMSGIALLFHLVSRQTLRAFQKKAIQIGGIAATVFASLTIALLHDLMVSLALVCFMVAVVAILNLLYDEREIVLFALGILFLGLEFSTAVMYFGSVWLQFLPVTQKAALVLIGMWLFIVFHRLSSKTTRSSIPESEDIEDSKY